MKLIEAITKIDKLKHNTYDKEEKLAWLSELDGIVKQKIIDTHEGGSQMIFTGYDIDTPDDTQLLVPAPYDGLYLHWLESKIDYYNGEYSRYNNAMMLFNTGYGSYAEDYHRTHKPLCGGTHFL